MIRLGCRGEFWLRERGERERGREGGRAGEMLRGREEGGRTDGG